MPINPYGKAKKMAEDIILDLSKQETELAVMILRLVLITSRVSVFYNLAFDFVGLELHEKLMLLDV